MRPFAPQVNLALGNNMAKIQDTFKELIKNTIAPKLREFGLKGSGQNYFIKSDSYWALIGIQKSMYSDSNGLKFTINLYVVSKELWEIMREERNHFPVKPTANTHWGIGWNKRIGHLFPDELDHWWSFDVGTDIDILASEVIDAICSKAVPAMQEQIKNA